MTINILQIVLIIVFASLAYWVNGMLNNVPKLKEIVSVLIVVVAVIMLLASLFGKFNAHIAIS
jgi:hypothetical protein